MKRKEDEPKKGAPAYMNTYGDMMTLLLTFFVLLFSMSTVDAAKFKAFVASFDGGIGILDGSESLEENMNILGSGISQFPEENTTTLDMESAATLEAELKKIEQELTEYTKQYDLSHDVTVEKNGDEVIIRFKDTLLFDTAKASIKAGAIPALDTLGAKLRDYIEKGYFLKFEGHTDNVPINTAQFPSNWELSSARATAVARFYMEEMDFNPASLSIEGMSEYHPIGDNSTAEGRSLNRRVEIKVTKQTTS